MRARLVLAAILAVTLAAQARAAPCACKPHRAHGRHMAHVVRHPFRGAYHIPRFNQAEAEAEVHTQYRYRTPYLPYWVFP